MMLFLEAKARPRPVRTPSSSPSSPTDRAARFFVLASLLAPLQLQVGGYLISPMLSKAVAVLVVAATVSLAKTPPGFLPSSTADLFIGFNGIAAVNGNVVSRQATAKEPVVGTAEQLTGNSYAIIMIDLDIPPAKGQSTTSTLLHWMQTGLTPAKTATTVDSTLGANKVYMLQSGSATPAAFAPYIGPNPPARAPLSHQYTEILVETSGASTADLNVLRRAAAARQGFNANNVLTQANLATKVVAGNWFNVTNPGPAAKNADTGAGAESSTSSTGQGNGLSTDGTATTESGSSPNATAGMNMSTTMTNGAATVGGHSSSSSPAAKGSDGYVLAPSRGALLGLIATGLVFFRL